MSTTAVVCTSLVIAAAVYDVVIIQTLGYRASISRWFNSFSKYPAVVFACGYLAGHFFGFMAP